MEGQDEELVYLNTGLYSHLLEAGYNDVEAIVPPKQSSKYSDVHNEFKPVNIVNYESYTNHFGDCKIQIDRILKSTLIFEDDVVIIQNFLHEEFEDFNKRRFSMSQNICRISGIGIAFLSAIVVANYRFRNLPYRIIVPLSALPIVTCAIKRLHFNYKQNNNRKCISRLLFSLKQFSLLLHKSAQYIQECELIAYENPAMNKKIQMISKLAGNNVPDEMRTESAKWHMMFGLRMVMLDSILVMITAFQTAVLKLLNEFPLARNVDDIDYYLSHLKRQEIGIRPYEQYEISTKLIQKFKCLYLLLQSELLKRLCLSFNPSLWIQHPSKSMVTLFDVTRNVIDICDEQYRTFKEQFNAYYTFEKMDRNHDRTAVANKLDTKLKDVYFKTKTTANNLRAVAIEMRALEEFVETKIDYHRNEDYDDDDDDNSFVNNIEDQLQKVLQLYRRCGSFLDDLNVSVSNAKPKQKSAEPYIEPTPETDDIDAAQSIIIDNQPFVNRDEIYVAVSSTYDDDVINASYENDRDFLERGDANYSKNLMDELKVALKQKKLEWKAREKLALRQAAHAEYVVSSESEDDQTDNEKRNVKRKPTLNWSNQVDGGNNAAETITTGTMMGESSMFSRQIADISSKWGLNVDEICYSDGDDDHDDDDDDAD